MMRGGSSNPLIAGASFGLLASVVLSVLAALSYARAISWVDHTLDVQRESSDWAIAILDAARQADDYLTSVDPAALASFDAALAREESKSDAVARLVVDNTSQVANVERARTDARLARLFLSEIVWQERDGHHAQAIDRRATLRPLLDRFRTDIDRVTAEETRLLAERRTTAASRGLWTAAGGGLVTLASIAFLTLAWRLQAERLSLIEALEAASRKRLESLSQVATALAGTRAPAQVADVIVDEGMRAVGADVCTLYALNQAGDALELIGERGVHPEVLARVRRLTETSGTPGTFATLRSGEAIWGESQDDYASHFPNLASLRTDGLRAQAYWSMPLIAEGRPVGLLGMGFHAPRKFSPDDRVFISTFVRQCAQALLRASRLEREDEARNLLTTTLRSIGDAVIATDVQGRVTFMNAVAQRLTGWDDDDARRRPLAEVFHIFSEQTRRTVENPVEKVLREGKVVGLANHTILRSRAGAEIPIDDSAAPIRDENGRLFGVVLVFRDVTEEKRLDARREFLSRAGAALASSLDYRETLSTLTRLAVPQLADWCAIDVLDSGSRAPEQVAVAHVDPAKVHFARELAKKYPPDPRAVTGVPEVIRSGQSELYTEIPQELLEASAQDAEHLRMIRELRLASAMVVPIRGTKRVLGAMTFVFAESGRRYTDAELAFAEDFAHRAGMAIENARVVKELESARSQERILRDESEFANRAKDEFLATVSHELRTPLNAILGWTVMLRTQNLPADLERPLSVIERNARVQAKLIEDVLDVSRIISGKLALKLSAILVRETIEASIETVTPSAQGKGVALSFEIEEPSMLITADADRLQQIVWNLLANAVKFTPKGGSVSVKVARQGSNIRIQVADTGEGIRPSVLPFIFDPFHQADASTTRRHGGLGLGLAIVKQLVGAHGGTIEAASDGPGKGATFVVLLPSREPAVRGQVDRASPLPGGRALPRLDGLRLLVIDDEEDARALVGAVLRERGAEVHLAGSATEALDKLHDVRPDVVVSDIGMPEVDGYSLIRQIRALPATRGGRTPAVALTAYARVEDAERAFAAGFQMHVTKPVEPSQLTLVVANLGGRTRDVGPS